MQPHVEGHPPETEELVGTDGGKNEGSKTKLRIALIGTRGVPANYGGFETAVEEIGKRLVERGHHVTVYCRIQSRERPSAYLGMNLVHLPALRIKALETLSHSGVSVLHLGLRRRFDAAVVFNSANAPYIPLIRARGIPVATHVDGLEWKRTKWGGGGRRYYRRAEALAVRWSDALIADAQGIADYYATEFDVGTDLIAYGAPILTAARPQHIDKLGLEPGKFHLVVARFEPENNVLTAVEGYRQSNCEYPLIVVGSAPYAHDYTNAVEAIAAGDPRIKLMGPVWDQDQLNELYVYALSYVHGHSVGGTNPSLLRAMGAGTAVIAYDVVFNREVLGESGRFFSTAGDVARELESYESAPDHAQGVGRDLQDRAAKHYDWEDVADRYEALCRRLASGESQAGTASGRRRTATHDES